MLTPRVLIPDEVVPDPDRWVLTEDTLPESSPHDLVTEHLRQLLLAWADRAGRAVKIGRNLAVRWDRRRPSYGVDPDVYVVAPPPPEGDRVRSLRLWRPGHHAPLLAIEIVSETEPRKDYEVVPPKYAVCGVRELWVLDPLLAGPRTDGGPYRVQVWRRGADRAFERAVAGEGPGWSEAVQAWVHVSPDGAVRICADQAGRDPWLTREEAERAAKEAERAAKEAERAARMEAERRADAAQRELAELRMQLARSQ